VYLEETADQAVSAQEGGRNEKYYKKCSQKDFFAN